MDLQDIAMPDMHFWHSFSYRLNYHQWVTNGSVAHFRAMLESIAYTDGMPAGPQGWDRADDWNDSIFFGEKPEKPVKYFSWCACRHHVSKHHYEHPSPAGFTCDAYGCQCTRSGPTLKHKWSFRR